MTVFLILWVLASFINVGVSIRLMFYMRKATRTEKEKVLADPNFQDMAMQMYTTMKKENVANES